MDDPACESVSKDVSTPFHQRPHTKLTQLLPWRTLVEGLLATRQRAEGVYRTSRKQVRPPPPFGISTRHAHLDLLLHQLAEPLQETGHGGCHLVQELPEGGIEQRRA